MAGLCEGGNEPSGSLKARLFEHLPSADVLVVLLRQSCPAASNMASSNQLCRRCKSKVSSGLKCSNCESLFHNSCAKVFPNMKIIDENVVQCCEKKDGDPGLYIDIDDAFNVALYSISDSDNKIDIRIFNYVLKQKDEIIRELQERIKLLGQHVDLLTKHTGLETNVCQNKMEATTNEDENSEIVKCSDNSIIVGNKSLNAVDSSVTKQKKTVTIQESSVSAPKPSTLKEKNVRQF
ncbi:hypothetical protein ANN_12700 [Periplaneta americana]|uniref:Phorbol-ester/DAG-type domain-containing protein n=1 Tax=Periplaneta americana TaxID=6978 RepID=A0ABQ8TJG7_PERAM|nr:hypothetical protein ANN_12700 [Periplaneta americana]